MAKKNFERQKDARYLWREVERLSKPHNCLLCGKVGVPICNSHVVPQFILKQIAQDGMLWYGQSLNKKSDLINTRTGIKNAFTFKLICRECDKRVFSNYENPDFIYNYENYPIDKRKLILIEMAIKSHLSHLYTKIEMYNLSSLVYPENIRLLKSLNKKTSAEIDIAEHKEYITKLINSKKRKVFPFEVIYSTILDYKIGIASQTLIAYVYDLDGNKYFDPKNLESAYEVPYFYLILFPYKDTTRVMFYIEKRNLNKVKSIVNCFKKMSDEEKIHFLFISLIMYDEQFYINPMLKEIMDKDRNIKKLYRSTDRIDNINANIRMLTFVNIRMYKNNNVR